MVEQRLSDLFRLATKWDAILLLDEADVFMQERTLQDLDRNQLVSSKFSIGSSPATQVPIHQTYVSALLRVLEYYEGILFLTTNRVETIDHAFQSRIHLSIAYPPLSADARRELWNSFIVRANHGQPPEWLTKKFLDRLVKDEVNGREIKKILRIGYSLARNAKRDLQPMDLLQGLDALKQFHTDFCKLSK